ncbi:MAG: ETC complex I subunit [Alphaproteobacteria bacterium]
MEARIYRPAKTAMQSGWANARKWLLEFEPEAPETTEPLMGWTSRADTTGQVRLGFPSKEEAIAFARRHGLAYRVFEPRDHRIRPKSYADNFRYDRVE